MEGESPLKFSGCLEIWRQLQGSEADRKVHSLIMTLGKEPDPDLEKRREQICQDYKDTVFRPELYWNPSIVFCM